MIPDFLVPVSAVHDATIRALAFARSLRPAHLEALFLVGEPEEADQIMAEWRERNIDVPLTAIEAPSATTVPPSWRRSAVTPGVATPS